MNASFRQTSAFAMHYGSLFGLLWVLGFYCHVLGFNASVLHLFWLLSVVAAPLVGFYLSRRFERTVREDGPVNFGRAYLFSVLLYLFATVTMAVVVFVHMRFADQGAYAASLVSQMQTPEAQAMLAEEPLASDLRVLLDSAGFATLEEVVLSLKPMDWVTMIVNYNVMFGIVLSLPAALLGRTPRSGRA